MIVVRTRVVVQRGRENKGTSLTLIVAPYQILLQTNTFPNRISRYGRFNTELRPNILATVNRFFRFKSLL